MPASANPHRTRKCQILALREHGRRCCWAGPRSLPAPPTDAPAAISDSTSRQLRQASPVVYQTPVVQHLAVGATQLRKVDVVHRGAARCLRKRPSRGSGRRRWTAGGSQSAQDSAGAGAVACQVMGGTGGGCRARRIADQGRIRHVAHAHGAPKLLPAMSTMRSDILSEIVTRGEVHGTAPVNNMASSKPAGP